MKEIDLSLIIRHLEHKGNPAESQLLCEWINDCEENREEYYRMVKLWAIRNAKKFSGEKEIENAVRTFNATVDSRNGNRRMKRLLAFTSSAAAALAAALIVIGAANLHRQLKWHTLATGPDDAVQQIHLGDGTKVFLNRSSEISFRDDFNRRKRSVKLQGEAYFEVVSDPLHPFLVSAGDATIKVLGTSFNVRTGETIETVLEKGRVELQDRRGNLVAALKPGQLASYHPSSGDVHVRFTNTSRHTSWRFDQQIYESVSLLEIVGMLEERFGVSVSLSNGLLDGNRYRLVIRNDESLRDAVEKLKYIAPIDYVIDNNHVMIKIRDTSR